MGKKVTTKDFINKAEQKHGNRYDYSKVNYINAKTKVTIICSEHGEFQQTPNKHLTPCGCPKCGFISRCNKVRSNTEEFMIKSLKVHGDNYNYDKVEYTGRDNKVTIICPKHVEFQQTPHNHLAGNGCPICRESKGEKEVRNFLLERNINFIPQKRFHDCRDILPLPFDFYLPDYNICIEYNGIQHYKPRTKFGGTHELEKIKHRDNIKNEYCEINGINLIVIKYTDNVNTILSTSI